VEEGAVECFQEGSVQVGIFMTRRIVLEKINKIGRTFWKVS